MRSPVRRNDTAMRRTWRAAGRKSFPCLIYNKLERADDWNEFSNTLWAKICSRGINAAGCGKGIGIFMKKRNAAVHRALADRLFWKA